MAKARKTPRLSQRGVALIMVVVGIAVLTVVGAEFAYNSRVDLQLAANQRDEIRAYFLARSSIGLSRLVLRFQKQLDQLQIPNPADLLGKVLNQGPGGAQAGGAVPQPSSLSIQIWKMAKVDCYLLQGLVASEEEPKLGVGPRASDLEFDRENPEEAERQKQRNFGGFEGCFSSQISDEEERTNLAKLDAPALSSLAVLARTLTLFGDKRYEFLFEREDSHRVKTSPTDLILAIRDWMDEDEVQSALNLSGQGEPFVKGFSDENSEYDRRYNPRYRAKNARFDSLEELYLVHGVNDRFMAAFGDKVTVFPGPNSRPNVNSDDPLTIALNIISVAANPRDPRLADPIFLDSVIKKVQAAKLFALFGFSVLDFCRVVESAGIPVNSSIINNPVNQRQVGDKSFTYRIRAVGEAGAVQKTITAVVRMDLDEKLGTLVYWKEE